MNIIWSKNFDAIINSQSGENAKTLRAFFETFNEQCKLAANDKYKLWEDFEKMIAYCLAKGESLERTLELIDIIYLGDFYGKAPKQWFPLDNIAKLYPLSMERGKMSVYRVSAYLYKEVVPEVLQMALNFTIKRFPSFSATLKKGFFWHYLDTTNRHYYIETEQYIPCSPMKISRSGSQAFRVIYYQNRISVEFFHVLSDGVGSITFLNALIAEYLRLMGEEISLDDMIFNVNDKPEKNEFENAFKNVPRKTLSQKKSNRRAVQLQGKLSKFKPCQIIHLRMNATKLREIAKNYQTSITGYLLALMFMAGKETSKSKAGYMNIQLPVNLRKYYPTKSIRNFAFLSTIGMSIEDIDHLDRVVLDINQQIEKKTSKEAMEGDLSTIRTLIMILKYVPLAIKQPIVKRVYRLLGDKACTTMLSNLGMAKAPLSIEKHIQYIDTVIGATLTQRARCSVITFNNIATLSITKATEKSDFEEKIVRLLEADGIEMMVEGSEIYGY